MLRNVDNYERDYVIMKGIIIRAVIMKGILSFDIVSMLLLCWNLRLFFFMLENSVDIK